MKNKDQKLIKSSKSIKTIDKLFKRSSTRSNKIDILYDKKKFDDKVIEQYKKRATK